HAHQSSSPQSSCRPGSLRRASAIWFRLDQRRRRAYLLCRGNVLRPSILTVPPLRDTYGQPGFRLGLHFLLMGAFALAAISLVLRSNKVLGFTSIGITLLATVL